MNNYQPTFQKSITVTVNGKKITAEENSLLSKIMKMEALCGGHGKCGKCKIFARGSLSPVSDSERDLLSEKELAHGIRLACLTRAVGDCEIASIQSAQNGQMIAQAEPPKTEIKPGFTTYGVCVDIGTTTLAARLYDTHGTLLAEDARLNPQSSHGADVISRIEAAMEGADADLATAIRGALNDIFSRLAELAKINAGRIDGVVLTGNTVMLSLLTGESTEPLSHAPFATRRLFGETLTAEALDLHMLSKSTPVYLPPCISAFVGADTVCAILATALCDEKTAMLADIGTNGEMALWHDGELTVCSVAAGPAFEGVGISMGMRANAGAIDKVSIVNGIPFAHVIGELPPVGICGSGLLDAASCMLDLEILDESGYLEEPFAISPPVWLNQRDLRMLQLAKSAVCAGLITLMKSKGLYPDQISALWVAGGFGAYLNPRSAVRIGLLPKALAERMNAVGNAALTGASLLLLNTDARDTASKISTRAVTLSLAESPIFAERYISCMALKPCD